MNATITRLTRLTDDPAGDGPLLDAFLSGDQRAFAVLVRRHAALVFGTCRRVLRHYQDAEDAFQATFLVLARRAADVWPREALGSWLFGVAQRVALKARTARALRGRLTGPERPLEEVACPQPAPPEFDLAEVVYRVVGKLPEVYRAAVVACDLEGLSRKEAAERLGWSEGTLSGRLARARDLLARRFRRLGLELPAGGLLAVVGIPEPVFACAVQTTIDLAIGTAGVGVSAPVAALTEGVVRSMVLFKFKATTAVVLVACALGFGAFAATGMGAGDGSSQPSQTQSQGTPVAPQPAAPPAAPPAPAKPVTDRDRFQGSWRIVAFTEGGKTTPTNPKEPWVIEVSGNTLRMPYLEAGSSSSSSSTTSEDTSGGTTSSTSGSASSGATWTQREYTFTLEPAKQGPDSVGTIDLKAPRKAVGKGVYAFTAPVGTCTKCHGPNEAGGVPLVGKVKDLAPLGVCAPGLKLIPVDGTLGLRLAVGIDGSRPTKFGGDGTIVFELMRQEPKTEDRARVLEAQKRLEARLKEARGAEEKARLEAELKELTAQLNELYLRESHQRAFAELQRAEAELERARAESAVAKVNLERAASAHKLAQAQVALAERAVADLKKPQPGGGAAPEGPVFTVHIRPLTAPEKVIRVKATGNETVLGGLVYAADDVLLKSDGLSVWVARNNEVLAVDLPGITKKGDTSTNYILKAGDRLFVQAKPGK